MQLYILLILSSPEVEVKWTAPEKLIVCIINYPESILLPETGLVRISWTVLWRLTRPFRINTPKRCPFHYTGLECKSTKSRNTWSNKQTCPWNREWSRAKTNRVLPRECTGHTKHLLPTTQEDTWTSWDGQHQNQIDYILCSQRWRSSIQSAKTRLGTDCGSDHDLFIAKFRLKFIISSKCTMINE